MTLLRPFSSLMACMLAMLWSNQVLAVPAHALSGLSVFMDPASMANGHFAALLLLVVVLGAATALNVRSTNRLNRQLHQKEELIKEQQERLHAKNLESLRQYMRLAETLMSEEEKESAIRGVHQQMTLDLHMVDDLLRTAISMPDERGVDGAILKVRAHLRSMAMVHECICRSADGARGGLQECLELVVRGVLHAGASHGRVPIVVDAPQVLLREDTLLPLGLLVTELLLGSMDHDAHGLGDGRISIAVRDAGPRYEVVFSDIDPGRSMADGTLRTRPVAMQPLNLLAARMNGEVRLLKGAGLMVGISFPVEKGRLRMAS